MDKSVTNRPSRGLRRMSRFFDSPLDRFFSDPFDFWNGNLLVQTVPSLNIRDEKNNYVVELAAPGLKKEDFDINVEGNQLTISCEKETETHNEEKENYSRKEYNYQAFSRTVSLPEFADAAKIQAKYNDGILELTIPKKAEAQNQTQKIKVQ